MIEKLFLTFLTTIGVINRGNPICDSNREYNYVQDIGYDEAVNILANQGRIQYDEPDYALGDDTYYTYYYEQHFQREIDYSRLSLFDKVHVGDLVYERDQIGGIGHIGIVESIDCYSDYGNFIRTIEAVGSKVQYCFLDDLRFVEKNMAILRVTNDILDIQEALDFAMYQIGKPYVFTLNNPHTDIDSISWYCSELVYAAYLYAGIDLTVGTSYSPGQGIVPNQIYHSSNTYQVSITKLFLNLHVLTKNRFTRNIRVFNGNNINITTGKYNSKMAFEQHAINWTNDLVYIQNFSIDAYDYEVLLIQENFFATHIAISYTDSCLRYITAANNLVENQTPSQWFVYQRID